MPNKPDKPKFIHVCTSRIESLFAAPVMIGGFYSWHLAMDGPFVKYTEAKGTLANYDIVMVAIAKPELDSGLIPTVAEEIAGTDTKLVIAFDYGLPLWQQALNPFLLKRDLHLADLIFCSDEKIRSAVEALAPKARPVVIPHPSNLEAIKKRSQPYHQRVDEVFSVIHRYDNQWIYPFLVTHDLPMKSTAILMDQRIESDVRGKFTSLVNPKPYLEYLEWAAYRKIHVDSYHSCHAYGRTAVDMAALGIPSIGTDMVAGQEFLWPELTTRPFEVGEQNQLAKLLWADRDFYDQQCATAAIRLETYSYQTAKINLLNALYEEPENARRTAEQSK